MPTMWWMECERKRLAKLGDLPGAATIAMEQLDMIKKGGYRPPIGSQCPTCGVEVVEEEDESDEDVEKARRAYLSVPRASAALKVLQGRVFD